MVLLRDTLESDIEDYVRWFTVETGVDPVGCAGEPVETDEERERPLDCLSFIRKGA